ncbi:MAG: hypothetical protein Kow002_21690 [Anaerolineales bacterium]
MYNKFMARKIRLVLAILLLVTSCVLLLWGLMPESREILIQPIRPDQMQLPTPASFFFYSEPAAGWLT